MRRAVSLDRKPRRGTNSSRKTPMPVEYRSSSEKGVKTTTTLTMNSSDEGEVTFPLRGKKSDFIKPEDVARKTPDVDIPTTSSSSSFSSITDKTVRCLPE